MREEWEAALADRIALAEPDVIVLAGWMRILGASFIERFPDERHPGRARIRPAPGSARRAAGQRGDRARSRGVRGRGTHDERRDGARGRAQVDAGPVIVSEPLAIAPVFEDFEAAMHALEHRLIVQAVASFLGGS